MANRLGEMNRAAVVIQEDVERARLQKQKRDLDALLRSWLDVDEQGVAEQRETLEILKRTLNEDRLSDRPRFK